MTQSSRANLSVTFGFLFGIYALLMSLMLGDKTFFIALPFAVVISFPSEIVLETLGFHYNSVSMIVGGVVNYSIIGIAWGFF